MQRQAIIRYSLEGALSPVCRLARTALAQAAGQEWLRSRRCARVAGADLLPPPLPLPPLAVNADALTLLELLPAASEAATDLLRKPYVPLNTVEQALAERLAVERQQMVLPEQPPAPGHSLAAALLRTAYGAPQAGGPDPATLIAQLHSVLARGLQATVRSSDDQLEAFRAAAQCSLEHHTSAGTVEQGFFEVR